MNVVPLRSADTHRLRREVLRTGTVSSAVEFDGDDLADTLHLGVEREGETVAISTWLRRRHPDLADRPAHQLRGMATAPSVRGTGVGALLLRHGLELCSAAGSSLVWARSRVTALAFYERIGFEPRGPSYTDLTTGLDHIDIVIDLPRSPLATS